MRTGGDGVADMSEYKGHAKINPGGPKETTRCSEKQQEPADSRQGSKSPGHFADAVKFLSPSPSHTFQHPRWVLIMVRQAVLLVAP